MKVTSSKLDAKRYAPKAHAVNDQLTTHHWAADGTYGVLQLIMDGRKYLIELERPEIAYLLKELKQILKDGEK